MQVGGKNAASKLFPFRTSLRVPLAIPHHRLSGLTSPCKRQSWSRRSFSSLIVVTTNLSHLPQKTFNTKPFSSEQRRTESATGRYFSSKSAEFEFDEDPETSYEKDDRHVEPLAAIMSYVCGSGRCYGCPLKPIMCQSISSNRTPLIAFFTCCLLSAILYWCSYWTA